MAFEKFIGGVRVNLKELYPQKVFEYFSEIASIPHGSGNEKQLSDYIVAFAKARSLECYQDSEYNVIIKKKGTIKSAPVILQGHIDMVCEKDADSDHNFLTDGITLKLEGDYISSDRTTLGADNGIAVAYALALLDSDDIEHPPLEVLLTTNEETGMNGAAAVNACLLNGRRLINLDSEEEGVFLASCAGGMRINIVMPIAYKPIEKSSNMYKLSVSGLKGGHSGMMIIEQRANANKVLGRVLNYLYNNYSIGIIDVNGGAKDNAIARESAATIVSSQPIDSLSQEIAALEQSLRKEYSVADSIITLKIHAFCDCDADDTVTQMLDDKAVRNIISLLMLLPNGVREMSREIVGLVQTSANLGVLTTDKDRDSVILSSSIRSCISSSKQNLLEEYKLLAAITDSECITSGEYPAWEYNAESKLRDVFSSEFYDMYGYQPKIEAIHAGLECGLLGEKLAGCDMISLGPNMYDVHTPLERVSISSVQNVWKLLCRVLGKL